MVSHFFLFIFLACRFHQVMYSQLLSRFAKMMAIVIAMSQMPTFKIKPLML